MKVVTIIATTYNFGAHVVHNNKLTDAFEIQTGVRQGCLLFPPLFLVVMDWITRESDE